jgi:hypothetical protein
VTTANLELPEVPEAIEGASDEINNGFRRLDSIVQLAVLSQAVASPPSSAAQGSRYIIAANATGRWYARDGKIAYRDVDEWLFLTPREGWFAWVADEEKLYRYKQSTSEWVEYISGVLAGAVGATALTQEILADSPTAFWKFNESSGTTVTDYSGNGYHMTLSGAYTQQFTGVKPGLSERLTRFNSGTGKARIQSKLGGSPPLVGDWTVECTFLALDFGTNPLRLFYMEGSDATEANNRQIQLAVNTSGQFTVSWQNSAGTNQNTNLLSIVQRGHSYHVICVKDGTANTLTLYVNGALVFETTYTIEPTGGTGSLACTVGAAEKAGNSGDMTVGYVAVYLGQKLNPDRVMVHARAAGF